jgi:hypothetical protein
MLYVMESLMNGKVFKWMALALFIMAWAIVAEGELLALAWLPAMLVLVFNHAASPEPMPPKYVPKKHRRATTMDWVFSSWWARNDAKTTPDVIRPLLATTLGSGRFNQRGPFHYQLYNPAKKRAAMRSRIVSQQPVYG